MSEEQPIQPATSSLRRRGTACLLWVLIAILLGRISLILHAPVYSNPEWWFKVGMWMYLLLPISFVTIFAWPPAIGQKQRPIIRRLRLCALIGWFIQVAINYCILENAIFFLSPRINDPAMVAVIATYFGGWLIAFILAFPFIPIAPLCDTIGERRRRKKNGYLEVENTN